MLMSGGVGLDHLCAGGPFLFRWSLLHRSSGRPQITSVSFGNSVMRAEGGTTTGVKVHARSSGKIGASLRTLAIGLLTASLGTLAGCPDPEVYIPEAPTRRIIPIPVCTEQLAPPRRKAGGGVTVRSVDPEQWLEIIVPSYEIEKGMNPTDVDCTGHFVFANELLRFGMARKGWPRKIDVEEIDMRAGPGGLRVLRLRALEFENGDLYCRSCPLAIQPAKMAA